MIKRKSFTLIELIVCLAIISVMILVIRVNFINNKKTMALEELKIIAESIENAKVFSIENKGIKHQSPRHNIVDQEVTEGPEFLRLCNRCQEDMIDDSSDEDGHSYTTFVSQEFGVSRRIPFFEVIDDKENQTRKDQNIG